jgi:enterochelin esterase-like enzyme
MQDGQNLFDTLTSDRGEWRVDETVETLTRAGRIAGLIVVGIDHGERYRALEYMPASLRVIPNAEGEKYAEFVVRTLKPYIDARFRTLSDRAHTAVAGSSAGAQISFFLATEYPDVFFGLGALGFVMGKGAKENIQQWRETHTGRPGTRMYLHVGDEENLPGIPNAVFVEHLRALHQALIEAGYESRNTLLDVEAAGHHNEATWSKRFPSVIQFLFPTRQLVPAN